MAGIVFTSTKRPPMSRAGTDTCRRPLISTRVREAPRPRRFTLATFSVSVDGWLELYQLFRSPTTPWLTFRLRKRSTSCVAPVCSSVSRLTTVTAWGMLMAGASMAVPVTETVTLLEEPAEGQVDVQRGSKPRSQLHLPFRPLEAGQGEGDGVAAGGAAR